jgi:hypothetical protein
MISRDGAARVGWMLFLAGSALFVVAAIQQRDVVTSIASVMFVIGVVAFLVAERVPARCPTCHAPLPGGTRERSVCKHCRPNRRSRRTGARARKRVRAHGRRR